MLWLGVMYPFEPCSFMSYRGNEVSIVKGSEIPPFVGMTQNETIALPGQDGSNHLK